MGVDNRVLREVLNLWRLGYFFVLLLCYENCIFSDSVTELCLSSPNVVIYILFNLSPREAIVFTQVKHVVLDTIDSGTWSTDHAF